MKQNINANGPEENRDKAANGGSGRRAKLAPGVIAVLMLTVASLWPSGWNPNVMTAEQEAEFEKEMRRLGRPPKPIVVRKKRNGYQIVDGEHSWNVARKCGFTEVPCEIIDADDFEAMLQCYKRNLHGENDPVKLGRFFQLMMQERGLSRRALAAELGITEGTVRNFVTYAEAADARNRYAAENAGDRTNADVEIAALAVRQVRAYLDLLPDQRDEWLDAGARLDEAERIKAASALASQETEAASQPVCQASGRHAETESVETHQPDDPIATDDAQDDAGDPAADRGNQDEPFDQGILDSLEGRWKCANRLTREKFLAGILADPMMLAFARRVIKQGT